MRVTPFPFRHLFFDLLSQLLQQDPNKQISVEAGVAASVFEPLERVRQIHGPAKIGAVDIKVTRASAPVLNREYAAPEGSPAIKLTVALAPAKARHRPLIPGSAVKALPKQRPASKAGTYCTKKLLPKAALATESLIAKTEKLDRKSKMQRIFFMTDPLGKVKMKWRRHALALVAFNS